MAYVSANLVKLDHIGASGGALWAYDAGADAAATIAGAGYISDAAEGTSVAKGASKGMTPYDLILVRQGNASGATGIDTYAVSAIAASGAATIIKTSTA